MIRTRGATIALASLLVFGGACGNGSHIPESLSGSFNAQVDRIEQMASAGDYAGARQRTGDLRMLVIEQRESGGLDDASAARILGAVSAVESALSPSTSTTVKVPPTTTTKRKPPGKDKNGE